MNIIIFGVFLNELEFPQRWRWCLKDLSNAVARSYVPKEVRRGDDLHDGDYGSNPNTLVWKLTSLARRRKRKKSEGKRKHLEISFFAAMVNHNISNLLGRSFCLITTLIILDIR